MIYHRNTNTIIRECGLLTASLRQRAYEHIRYKLVTGVLRPGVRLSNRELAKEMEISTIPVREALTQLTSEGLLEHKPGVGVFVADLTTQELEDLCDVRQALECHCIRKAIANISETEIKELRACCRAMAVVVARVGAKGRDCWDPEDVEPWTLADARFHHSLLRASGNRRALKIVSDLRVLTYVFGYQDKQRTVAQLERTLDEHQRILEAIGEHDAVLASQIMAEHLERKRDSILRVYNRSRMEQETAGIPSITFPEVLRDQLHQIEEAEKTL